MGRKPLSARKTITVTLSITGPRDMPARAIRREVMTRVNEITGYYGGWSFDLPDSQLTRSGDIRIVAKPERTHRNQTLKTG